MDIILVVGEIDAMNRLWAGALILAGACAGVPSADHTLREQLVGRWGEAHHLDNAHLEQSIELSRDGRLRIERAVHDATGTKQTSLQGRWRIENGDFIIYEAPGACSKTECRMRVVAVTDWEWVMEDAPSTGEFRAWRYPQ
jgi:hypothetical protein